MVDDQADHREGAFGAVPRKVEPDGADAVESLVDHVDQRGRDEVLAGREVVLGGSPRDAGGGGHRPHGGRRPALRGEEVDRGSEQSLPRDAAAVLLGGALLGCRHRLSSHQSCSS